MQFRHRWGQARTAHWQHARAVVAALLVVMLAAARPAPAPAPPRDLALEATLRRHIETLASDDYGGREPGTDGETKTLRYLAREWFDIGLVSGTNDPGNAWFAPVELVERMPQDSRATFQRGHRRVTTNPDGVFVVTSGLRSLIEDAPLLYVGGDTNPDAARLELAGRIALILDSQSTEPAKPGKAAPEPANPAGPDDRAGRLLDAGAAAVITVLDGTRKLEDVAAHRRRPGYALAGQKLGGDLQAYITPEVADVLLEAGGVGKLDALRTAAAASPRLIGINGTLEATGRETRIHTHNLIGKLEGRRPDLGAVVMVAHWDHFGRCADHDDSIAVVLKSMRRKTVSGNAANAYVRRQDGWAFIQHDVPAVMVSSAYSDAARLEKFMDERYHRPTDVAARVEYGGMGEDVALQVELARYFADVHRFPGPPVPRLDSATR